MFYIHTGTGKTYALAEVIKKLVDQKKEVILCGATGLSSIVLKEKIGILENVSVTTVHSAFGLLDGRYVTAVDSVLYCIT